MKGIKKIKILKIVKKPMAIGIAVGVVLAVVGDSGSVERLVRRRPERIICGTPMFYRVKRIINGTQDIQMI